MVVPLIIDPSETCPLDSPQPIGSTPNGGSVSGKARDYDSTVARMAGNILSGLAGEMVRAEGELNHKDRLGCDRRTSHHRGSETDGGGP
jgi:hypothetical protein